MDSIFLMAKIWCPNSLTEINYDFYSSEKLRYLRFEGGESFQFENLNQ